MDNIELPTNNKNESENELINPSFLGDNSNTMEQLKEETVIEKVVSQPETTVSDVPDLASFEVSKQEVNVVPEVATQNNSVSQTPVQPVVQNTPAVEVQNQSVAPAAVGQTNKPAKTAISALLDAESDQPLTDDEQLLIEYLGPSAENILEGKFNIGALLFNVFYFYYNKMILKATLFLVIEIIITSLVSTFVNSLTLIAALGLDVLFAFLANNNILDNAQKQVEKIKSKNPNASLAELKEKCKKAGTGSLLTVGIGIVIFIVVIVIASIIMAIFGLAAFISGMLGPNISFTINTIVSLIK